MDGALCAPLAHLCSSRNTQSRGLGPMGKRLLRGSPCAPVGAHGLLSRHWAPLKGDWLCPLGTLSSSICGHLRDPPDSSILQGQLSQTPLIHQRYSRPFIILMALITLGPFSFFMGHLDSQWLAEIPETTKILYHPAPRQTDEVWLLMGPPTA